MSGTADTSSTVPAPTAQEIERYLNFLAVEIEKRGLQGEAFLPLYERLERELAALHNTTSTMDMVRARAKQFQDQTEAQFS